MRILKRIGNAFLLGGAGALGALAIHTLVSFAGIDASQVGKRPGSASKSDDRPETKTDIKATKPSVSETGSIVRSAKPSRDEIAECKVIRAAHIADAERKFEKADKDLVDCLASVKANFLIAHEAERRCELYASIRLGLSASLKTTQTFRC